MKVESVLALLVPWGCVCVGENRESDVLERGSDQLISWDDLMAVVSHEGHA